MPTPIELSAAPSTERYAGESEVDGFSLGAQDEDDGLYVEISERRAQLENADILRGARAL